MPEPYWLKTTKPAPVKPANLPANAQWLSGEGDGSWFSIDGIQSNKAVISRFSAKGRLECKSIFTYDAPVEFVATEPYTYTYMSHCREVRILQKEHLFVFTRAEKII